MLLIFNPIYESSPFLFVYALFSGALFRIINSLVVMWLSESLVIPGFCHGSDPNAGMIVVFRPAVHTERDE